MEPNNLKSGRATEGTVLVTGGCGFIGSHLVTELLRQGRRVIALDNLRHGNTANLQEISNPNLKVIKFSIGQDSVKDLLLELSGVNAVYHLAAEKHNQSKDDPIRLMRSNIEGPYELLLGLSRQGVERIVFTSSLYAYGRMNLPEMTEEEPLKPSTLYGITKAAGEHLMAFLNRETGVTYNTLRLFFVYGPKQYAGQGYKSVILKNFERIISNKRPIIFGDGSQELDYIFVDDVVKAIILAMETDINGHVFNVSSGTPVAVRDLITNMLKTANCDLEPQYEPPDWTAGSCRVGDNTKMRQELGCNASTSLAEGLKRTFDWISKESQE